MRQRTLKGFTAGNRLASKLLVFCVGAVVLFGASIVRADYVVTDQGVWPTSWPEDLEGLRKQSQSFEGPFLPQYHHAIAFFKREDFEKAWQSILKVKTPGSPILLRRGKSFWFDAQVPAGVCVHMPIEAEGRSGAGTGLIDSSITIELIVDGKVIDLNRIPLPPDTPIIDERFKDKRSK